VSGGGKYWAVEGVHEYFVLDDLMGRWRICCWRLEWEGELVVG
jgi:hypothetical protein